MDLDALAIQHDRVVERVSHSAGLLYIRGPGWEGHIVDFETHGSFSADGLSERQLRAVLAALEACESEPRQNDHERAKNHNEVAV